MANNQRQKNIVIQNEFFFTYDLQLGFYSKLQSINTIKLYKRDGNRFVDDTRPDNPYLTSYHPEQEVVQKILNVLQNDSFSVVLKESDMNWYKETADLYTQDKELILEHREILYNFLIYL